MRNLLVISLILFVIIISGCVNNEVPKSSVYLPTENEIESLGYTVIDIDETLDYESGATNHLSSSNREFYTNYNGLGYFKTESVNAAVMLFDGDESATVEFNRISDEILSASSQDANMTSIEEPALFDDSIFLHYTNSNRYEGYFRKDKVVFFVFINADRSLDDVIDIANIIGNKIG